MKQLFFIEGRYFGEAPRGLLEIDRGIFGRPLSKLFYCERCGEVFARCPMAPATAWTAVFACCRQCPPRAGQHIPGSIWHYELEFVAAFPDAVLRWEVDRHLEQAERDLDSNLQPLEK